MKSRQARIVVTLFAVAAMMAACGLSFSLGASRVQAADGSTAAEASAAAEAKDVDAPLTCPKCKGSMELGAVLDYFDDAFNFRASGWAPGRPKYHVLAFTQKTKKITTYRCASCGYLESYAK